MWYQLLPSAGLMMFFFGLGQYTIPIRNMLMYNGCPMQRDLNSIDEHGCFLRDQRIADETGRTWNGNHMWNVGLEGIPDED